MRKQCRRCGAWRGLSAFGRDRHKPDGLNIYCRPCASRMAGARRAKSMGKSDERFGVSEGVMVQRQRPIDRYLDAHALSVAEQAART